jgi:hypothetical protein
MSTVAAGMADSGVLWPEARFLADCAIAGLGNPALVADDEWIDKGLPCLVADSE